MFTRLHRYLDLEATNPDRPRPGRIREHRELTIWRIARPSTSNRSLIGAAREAFQRRQERERMIVAGATYVKIIRRASCFVRIDVGAELKEADL